MKRRGFLGLLGIAPIAAPLAAKAATDQLNVDLDLGKAVVAASPDENFHNIKSFTVDGRDQWVVIGDKGRVLTSTDGINWTDYKKVPV